MATSPPIGSGDVSRLNRLAHEELQRATADRVKTARARAEKWVGGLTAITGLLGVVFVVEGPDATKIDEDSLVVVAALFGLSLALLALATLRMYQAAFGRASTEDQVPMSPAETVFERLFKAREKAATDIRDRLKAGIFWALLGIASAAAGIIVTWFAPEPAGSATSFTCVFDVDGTEVARFPGKTLEVTSIGEATSVGPCS